MIPEADPPDPSAVEGMSAVSADTSAEAVESVVKALLPRNASERLRQLFSCEYKPLVNYVVGLGLKRVEAEDVAAQAFTQLLQSKDLGSISLLGAYLYRIARNITFNRYSHLAMQHRYRPLLKAEHSEEGPSLEPGLMGQQQSELIRYSLARLRPRRRMCVALRFWEDLSYPEIVQWFHERGIDINEKTVRRNVGVRRSQLFPSCPGHRDRGTGKSVWNIQGAGLSGRQDGG